MRTLPSASVVHYMTNEPYNQLTCQALSPHKSQVTLHPHPHTPPRHLCPRHPILHPPQRTHSPSLNLAHNFPWSVFNTAHKRCNSNDTLLIFKRFTWELRATLLGNHTCNARDARIVHIRTSPDHLTQHPPNAAPRLAHTPPHPRTQQPTPGTQHPAPERSNPPQEHNTPRPNAQNSPGLVPRG